MEKEKYQRTENPLLDEILQKYRDCSTDSISGPKGFGERVGKKPWTTTDLKEKQVIVSSVETSRTLNHPVLRSVTTRMHVQSRDQGTLKFKETLVDQFPLACFSYGGEKRLCFKDLVDKVLKGFSTQAINTARDRLQIFCPRCTPQQLEILKLAGVLPWSCTSAGLISKSDAFRLIGALTCSTVLPRNNRLFSVDSLEVYHECFGGCVGTLEIDLYTDPYAECVTCSQCDGVYSPRTFVTHTHSSGEVHTCHWGFDSAHWRLYLMLCNDHPTIHVQMMWEMLTSKFTEGSRRRLKREYVETGLADNEYNSSNSGESRTSPSFHEKKPREGRTSSPNDKEVSEERYVYCSNGVVTTTGGDIMSRRSAFRPWSPVGTNRTNGRTVENGIGNPLGILGPASSARIFAPSTISCINSDCHCTGPCSHKGQYPYKSSLTKSDDTAESSKIGEVISTPTTKDPMSLERTAKDMLDVVAQNNHGWTAFEEAYSHIKNGGKQEVTSTAVSFNEDKIYQTLLGYCQNGELPSAKELSSLLAKDFKDLFARCEARINQALQDKSKLEEIYDSSKRENAKNLDELYEELRKCKKELRLCQARYKDETHEQKNRINGLEAELRRYKLDKEGSGTNGSNESLEVLQQEVRDMCIKLEQKDSFCRELENELSSLHAWIKSSQRYHPTSSFVYSYGSPPRPESRTVIRSVQVVNGNSDKSSIKSNGLVHHDSSEDDM